MGQLKDLLGALTYTDGVADAQLIRERTRPLRQLTDHRWDFRQTMDNLFIEVEEHDHGSVMQKNEFLPLTRLTLAYGRYVANDREDAAFLLAAALRHWKHNEFRLFPSIRNYCAPDAEYIEAFTKEILLPEASVREMFEDVDKEDTRLLYSRVKERYDVPLNTLRNRLEELDLL